jgi:peptide methionine sulfoxide reductase MsrA
MLKYFNSETTFTTYDEIEASSCLRSSPSARGCFWGVQSVFQGVITYAQLLRIHFSVVHDPTQLNRQGPDVGTSYRSAICYTSEEQKRLAEACIARLDHQKVFPKRAKIS